jgi:glycosyltransferase involved in cell wall biosynthesis
VKHLQILFLCSWYPNKHDGFIGNFIQRHALSAAKHHTVATLSVHPSPTPEVQLSKNGTLTEARVYYQRRLPIISQYLAYKKGFSALQKQGFVFDLIHLNVLYPAALFALSKRLPLLISEHFSGYHKISHFKWTWFKKWVTQRTLRKSKLVMPVSHHLGKAIQAFEPHIEIHKISNVVDTSLFTPSQKSAPNKRFTFLHISTLEERSKNISGLLQGFKTLQDEGVDFLLQIGGDGDLSTLQEKIIHCGLSPQHVAIISPRPSADIAVLMQQADCFVLFSHFENQPCVILEALCCGTPVISSAVGGIPEEVEESNGLLVPAGDHQAFVTALQQMASAKLRYARTAIAQKAQTKYSMEAIGQQLSDCYLSALRASS